MPSTREKVIAKLIERWPFLIIAPTDIHLNGWVKKKDIVSVEIYCKRKLAGSDNQSGFTIYSWSGLRALAREDLYVLEEEPSFIWLA